MKKIKNMKKNDDNQSSGVFDLLDALVAEELGVDLTTYIDIMDNQCTHNETKFIILSILSERPDKIIKAKELFKSKKQ